MITERANLKLAEFIGGVGGLLVLSLAPGPALASSTGLNNIPTADTPPFSTIVLQSWLTLGDDRDAAYVSGFKMALPLFDRPFELGLDKQWGDEDVPAVLQFKYALALGEDLPTLGLGMTNVGFSSGDRDDAGQPFKFGVLTHDFGSFRAHAGYGFQQGNDAAFFGFDKTIELFERDLMLRTDFTQIDDQEQWMGSAGFIYFIDEHWAFESWVSQPFDDGDPYFTMKVNFAIPF